MNRILGFILSIPLSLLVLASCAIQQDKLESGERKFQPAAAVFQPLQTHEEAKEGTFMGGSLIYHASDASINQLETGMVIRLYIDRELMPGTGSTNKSFVSGYLRINRIDQSQVELDYALYQPNGSLLRHEEGVKIPLGGSLDLDGDQENELTYISAPESDMGARNGFEQANLLKFNSSETTAKRTMYGLNDWEYAGGLNRTGILAVNPCGAFTWDELSLSPTIDDGDSISITRSVLPDIQVFDRVIDYNTGSIRSVNGVQKTTSDTIVVHFEKEKNYTPFELSVTRYNGKVDDLERKYSRSRYATRTPSWKTFNLVDRTDGLKLFEDYGFLITITNHFKLDLHLMGSFDVGFIWVDAWAGAAIEANDTIMVYAKFTHNGTRDDRKLLFSPTNRFFIGYVPCFIALPIYIGVYSSFNIDNAYASWGYQVHGKFGAWAHGWAKVKIRWKWFIPYPSLSAGLDKGIINEFWAREVPLTAVFKGNITVRPYLEVVPTIGIFEGLLSFNTPAQIYLEGQIKGDAMYSNHVATSYSGTNVRGFIDIDLFWGVSIKAGLGVSFVGWHKNWDLGYLYNYRQKLVEGFHWLEPANPTNIIYPSNFTAQPTSEGSIKLTWKNTETATGYWVFKSTNTNAGYDKTWVTMNTYYDRSDLRAGTTYFYGVSAKNDVKESTMSPIQQAVPTAPVITLAPSAVSANADGSLHINWSSVANIAGYLLICGTNPGQPIWTNFLSSKTTSFDDYRPVNGVTYYYSLALSNYCGTGPRSSEMSGTPSKPAKVSNFYFSSISFDTVTLNWDPAFGATGYWIYRATNLGGTNEVIGYTAGLTLDDSLYNVVNPLLPGMNCYYTIVATNNCGNSLPSDFISNEMPPAGAPIVQYGISNNKKIYTNVYTLTGRAFLNPNTNMAVKTVLLSRDGVNYTPVDGTLRWSNTVTLNPGNNSFWICAVDNFDVPGSTNMLTVNSIQGLRLWSTLNDEASLTNPLIGPAGTCAGFTAGSGFGLANFQSSYKVMGGQSSNCFFPADVIPANHGCIEFWAMVIVTNLGTLSIDGAAPCFFSASDGTSTYGMEYNRCDQYNGNGLAGFAGSVNGDWGHISAFDFTTHTNFYFTNMIADALPGQQSTGEGYFHHYALVWDNSGVPGSTNGTIQMYVDGAKVGSTWTTIGGQLTNLQPTALNALSGGNLYILPSLIAANVKYAAMMNLKVWDYAKTNFSDKLNQF